MRMKILITGISGFIGRSLVEAIADANLSWDVYGVDIKPPMFDDRRYLDMIKFENLDIRDANGVSNYFSTNVFDGVVHLAAVSRVVDAEKNKDNCIATNLHGMRNVVDSVALRPNTWFIFGSSREVYGEQPIIPVCESAEKFPINLYGRCKLMGEQMVVRMPNPYCILRFSNVYGNKYDIQGRVIPKFIHEAIGGNPLVLEGGRQIIDFTHISDTVACIMRVVELLQERKLSGQDIHISPGVANKLSDVIDHIEHSLGRSLKVICRDSRDYDVQRYVGNPAKRYSLLGFTEFISLYEGVERLVEETLSLKSPACINP